MQHKCSPAAIKVLEERYLLRDKDGKLIETVEQLFRRNAKAVAKNPEDEEAFFEAMMNLDFLPNSPCLANAGKDDGQLSACFVLPVEDDLDAIFEAVKRAALIHKTGGGTGFSFSRLRPAGSLVKSSGHSASGPVSFMEVFDAATNAIKQGGMRRGANMGILRIDHPDIQTFIHCKDAGSRINNFNISVAVTDGFMKAKDAGGQFSLMDPQTKKHAGRLDAEAVWNEIAESAWKTGDPGMWFIDRVNAGRGNPVPYHSEVESCNPCLTGDTLIATVYEGPKSFKELADRGTDVLVYSWSPETKKPVVRWMRKPRLTRKNVEVLTVEFDSGLKVRCTPDHNFFSFRGQKVQAKDLVVGQSVRAFSTSIHRDGHIRAHGWDGQANKATHQWLSRMVWECENGDLPVGYVLHHINHDQLDNRIENLEVIDPIEHNRHHYPKRHANGFRGHEDFPEVLSRAKTLRAAAVNHKVVAIYASGSEDVYNGTVDESHTYIVVDPEFASIDHRSAFTGIVSANCGEQELYPNDACTLGSINLANFYSAATQNYDYDFVDYQRLATVTRLAVRFLDATLDVNHFPLQEIEQVVKSIRRIGLGVMGWHDLLMKLRIPYDSQRALDIAESVMQTIWETAWDESHQLAGKYGPFPLWWNSIHAKEREYRNSTVTTIAPTGTISLIAGCSSGIEPLFAFEFKHNGLEGKLTETIRHPFADLRDKEIEEFGEARVYKQANEISPEWHLKHQAAFQKFTDNAVSKTVNLPKSATVEDIKHIYQMAWDLGCKGVTVYRDGCRDTQVLERAEGGRVVSGMETEPRIIRSDGVDYTDAKLGKDVTYAFTPRPKVLPSVTIKQDSPVGNIYVTISEHSGEPCEVFTNAGKAGSDAQAMAEAASRTASKWMRDNPFSERRRILGLVAEQWSGIGGSTSSGFGANRVLSIPDAMSKAVERYLAREDQELLPITPTDVSPYPEVREAMPTSQNNPPQASLCPACHGLTMVREEGCMHCVACGESRC